MEATRPALSPPRESLAGRVRGPFTAAGGIVASAVAVHLRDPHRPGAWGWCPFLLITGWNCPFCGGLRAVHDLGAGHWSAALRDNVLVVLAAGMGVLVWVWWLGRVGRGLDVDASRWQNRYVGWTLVAVLAVFCMLRNTLLPVLAPPS